MNKLQIAFCFLFCVLQHISAQTFDRSFSSGCNTTGHLVRPYGADKWVLAGRAEPEYGDYFSDTLFYAVIDVSGNILSRKKLNTPPSEIHYWHDILPLPDGGILAVFESTLCDVGSDVISLQRFDIQGNLLWEKNAGFLFGTPRPPEKWFIAPDGNLLGVNYNQVWKLQSQTGNVLWQTALDGVDQGLVTPYNFELIPGTEHFIAVGSPSLQRWEKTNNLYQMTLSQTLIYSLYRIIPSPAGHFYAYISFPEKKVIKFNTDLQYQELPIVVGSYDRIGIAASADHIYFGYGNLGENNLYRYDANGQNELELPLPEGLYDIERLAAGNNRVAIAGTELSGLASWTVANVKSSSAWMRSFSEANPFDTVQGPDLSVIAVESAYTIDTTTIPYNPFGYVYNLFGGGFKVQVYNAGPETVQDVCINTTFARNEFFFICSNVSCKQVCFSQLNLAPGTSTWLNFGDISANGQSTLPESICFWPSSPNRKPDQNHSNDRYCHPASYTVGAVSPEYTILSAVPNPCDQFADVAVTEALEGQAWLLYDACGRVVSQGTCPGAGATLRVQTGMLPQGLYLWQSGYHSARLLVQH